MDPATTDERARALALRLVAVASTPDVHVWENPDTGTRCRLDTSGEYLVLRLEDGRLRPTVAGHIASSLAAELVAEPDSLAARRAVAEAILAVDDPTDL